MFHTYVVQYSTLVNSIKVLQRKVKEIQQKIRCIKLEFRLEGLLGGTWPKARSEQHPFSGQICCLHSEGAGRAQDVTGTSPDRLRYSQTGGAYRPASVHGPHTPQDVWAVQVSIQTAFATTLRLLLRVLEYCPAFLTVRKRAHATKAAGSLSKVRAQPQCSGTHRHGRSAGKAATSSAPDLCPLDTYKLAVTSPLKQRFKSLW